VAGENTSSVGGCFVDAATDKPAGRDLGEELVGVALLVERLVELRRGV
jgi:hypothetical protein